MQKAHIVAIAALLMLTATAVIIADHSEAETYRLARFHIDDGVGGYEERTAYAAESHGYVLDPGDIPEIPDGYEWLTSPKPSPGGWIDVDYIRADLSQPIDGTAEFYAWDPSGIGERPEPNGAPETPTDGSIMMALAGIAVASIAIGAVAVLWRRYT